MKGLLKNVLIILLFLILTIRVSSADGPLQAKNIYPIFLHANQPYVDKADPEDSLSFNISHSSIYTVQESGDWIIHLDMEITELTLRYKKTFSKSYEAGIDIPVLIIGAGFMDGFLESYHDTFGFPDYGRSKRPHDEFLYEVRKNGRTIIKGRSGTRLGDIRLTLKKCLKADDKLRLSIQGDIELPVSNAKEGFSNGSIDAGVSLLLDKRFSENIVSYFSAGAVFPGDLKADNSLDIKNFFYAGSSVSYSLNDDYSLIAQILAQTSIYPDTDLEAVDRGAVMISFGGRYTRGNRIIDLSLTEDLSESGSPDFIVNLSIKVYI